MFWWLLTTLRCSHRQLNVFFFCHPACVTTSSCNVLLDVSSCCFSSHKYLPWPLTRLPDGYTFFSVSQERIMDEIDEEAKRARLQGPKTGANWDACCWTVCLSCTSLRRDFCGHWCHWCIFHGWLLFACRNSAGLFFLIVKVKLCGSTGDS